MPCKKKKQPLPNSKCSLSSRRLLETVPIQDLCQSAVRVCGPCSKQVNDPSPCSCGCDEDVSGPGTCCALDPQCEGSSGSHPAQALKIPTCVSNSQATEVEAMLDEIRNCREIIRALAQEAMDILHPENSQQYKQNLQPHQGPIANANAFCCEHCNDSEAKDLRQRNDCSKKSYELSEPRKYSGSEEQSTTPLFPIPATQPKSPTLSRKSSGPIAQTACQIKDKRLSPTVVIKKPSKCRCDGEKKQVIVCSCDETTNKNTLGTKPSNCGCDGEKKQNLYCSCAKTMNKKTLITKPSNCGCNGEEKLNINCSCAKIMNKITLGNKPSKCSCSGEKEKKADCRCESKSDCKTFILKTFGKKPSECFCNEEKNVNCMCDETIMKQNKENETDSKSCFQKAFGWISTDDEEKEKQNKAKTQEKSKAACGMPKCKANTCTCHFPPAYSQYFDCTGHVSGNCHCDKNA